ncbi:predicted protein [Naegleria gruberi]|uniref:Predicted protein n=1 Tax=Naegleria gruberi TaxID=5762 RepID=D2VQD7_NAEGR|nr:uncharacterized protein NAEGRDRAFT_71188 [Naegleria gruberi]EFC40855.1 predicted protein [Naegleria gruberi]|eukprot:XP_002673599.1 predicted protein [Naegleria gruberi strain NEG-M]
MWSSSMVYCVLILMLIIYFIEATESTITCNNIDSNLSNVCSGNGICISNNVCSCYVGFDGAACDTPRTIQNLFAGYSVLSRNSSISSNKIINLFGNVANTPSSSQLYTNFNITSGITHDGDVYASHYINQAEQYFKQLDNLPCDFTLRSSPRIGRIEVRYGGVGCFEAGWTGPSTVVIKGSQRVVFKIKGNFITNEITFALSKCASENNIYWLVNGNTKITNNFKGILKTAGKVDITNANIDGTLFINNTSATFTNVTFGPVSTFDPYQSLTNSECSLSSCYGILSNETSVCAGVGLCYDDNACFCPLGYGQDCSLPLCYGVLQNSASVCSGNGNCTGPDTCECKEGHLGLNCSISLPPCYGIGNDTSRICSGVGNCTSKGVCSCPDGYGFDCSVPICNGVLAYNKACSSHGTCIAPNSCSCSSHYHGDNCELTTCFDIPSDNSTTCSGNGDCIDYNRCRCFDGYQGSDCGQLTTTIIYENITIYENETIWIEYNTTEYINETIYIRQNQTDVVIDDGAIIFTPNPTGSNPITFNTTRVNVTIITYYNATSNSTTTVTTTTTTVVVYTTIVCSKSLNCSNHGECNSNGACTCYSNFDTGFWSGSSCNTCRDGFHGNNCATKVVGPAYISNDFTGVTFYLYAPNSYTSNQISCNKLLHPDDISSNMFGDASKIQCSYVDRASYLFMITFGSNDYVFNAGASNLRINTHVFDQSAGSADYLSMIINLPQGFSGPVAKISMAFTSTYSSCEEIVIDGSGSTAPYGGSLTYYWTLLNAATMQVLSTNFANQPKITLPASLSSGSYQVSLKIQGEFLHLSSAVVHTGTFTKAPKPVPVITFYKGNTQLRYTNQFPYTIKKVIESPCRDSNNTIVRWEQLSGPSIEYSVDSYNNLYIPKLKTFGNNNYTFKVSAYYTDANYQGSSDFVLITQSPPLSLELYQAEAKTDHSTVEVIYSDPESALISKSETWTWSSLDYQGPRLYTFLTTQSNQKSSSLYLTSNYFDPVPAMVTIQLRIEKSDGRFVQKSSIVRFGAVAPSFNVISQQPNTAYLKPGSPITIHSLVSSSSTSVFVSWRLNNEMISTTKTIIQSNWGRQINQVMFDTSNLVDGTTNTITAVVSDSSTQGTSTTTIVVQVAKRPSLCACDITPSVGIAMETQFSFGCTQCKTTDNNVDYNYGFIDDRSGMKVSLYKLGEVFSSTLPAPLNGNTLTCYIDIIDTVTGGSVNMTKKITVNKQSTTSLSEIQTLVKSWTDTVNQYLKDGQISKSFYMTATFLRTDTVLVREAIKVLASTSRRDIVCSHGVEVSGVCKCADGYVGTNCEVPIFGYSQSQSVKLTAFTNIIKLSNSSYDIINDEYFTLLVFSIDSVLENYEYLEKKTVGQALDTLNLYLTSVVAIDDFNLPNGVEILLKNIIQNTYIYVVEKQMFTDQTENSKKLLILLTLTTTLMSRTISYGSSSSVFKTQYFSYTMNKYSIYDFPPIVSDNSRICQIIVEGLFFSNAKSTKLYRQPFGFVMTVSDDVFQLGPTIGLQKSTKENIQASSSLVSPIMSLSFNGLTAPVDFNGIIYILPINKTTTFKIFDQGTFDYVESVTEYTCNSFKDSPEAITKCKLVEMNATHTKCSCSTLGNVFVMETTTITKYSLTIFVIMGASIIVIGSAIVTIFSFCCCCCRCVVIGRRRFSERHSEAKIVRVKHDVRAMFLEKPGTNDFVTTERVQLRNDNNKVTRTIITTDPLLVTNNTKTVVMQSPRMYTKETTYVTKTHHHQGGQTVVFDTPRPEVVIASRPRVLEEIVTNRPVVVRRNQVQPMDVELVERRRY